MRRPVHLLLLLCTAVVSVTCQSTVPFHLLHEDGQCARAGVYFMPTFNLESAQSSFIISNTNGTMKASGVVYPHDDDDDDDEFDDDFDDDENAIWLSMKVHGALHSDHSGSGNSFLYSSDCQGIAMLPLPLLDNEAMYLSLICSVSNVDTYTMPVVCNAKYSYASSGGDDDNATKVNKKGKSKRPFFQ